MKRSMMLKTLFSLFLACGLFMGAPPIHATEHIVQIDATAHQKFGLYYPVTYKFAIPAGATALAAQYRYGAGVDWKTLPEKSNSDSFNGIDAVRFDYAGGWAYVSIGFSRDSDILHLRILDGAGNPVRSAFDSIPTYYDGRKGAVTITLDDWNFFGDADMKIASDYLAARGLYFTVGIVAGAVNWSSVQQKLDQHGDFIEVASHSVNHQCGVSGYAVAGYETEATGSRDSIKNNLSFKNNPYVPAYLEPCGYSDAALVSAVTAGDYLLTRSSNNNFTSGSRFAAWDPVQLRYGRSAVVFSDSGQVWDEALLSKANLLFDQAMGISGIYHLTNHPWADYWYDGSYLLQHMDYIKGRNDLWYVPVGQMYMYHFLQEMRGGLTMQSVETPAPTASFTVFPQTGFAPLSAGFTDTSTGPITGWLWDFGDATSSTLQNPVHVYNNAGSYTVQLTVTGPGGSDTAAMTGLVVTTPPAPVANFSASPVTGPVPLTVTFTDTSTGPITGWLWEFGDGTTSNERNPVHIYRSPGANGVKLTVTGPGGTSSKKNAAYIKPRKN